LAITLERLGQLESENCGEFRGIVLNISAHQHRHVMVESEKRFPGILFVLKAAPSYLELQLASVAVVAMARDSTDRENHVLMGDVAAEFLSDLQVSIMVELETGTVDIVLIACEQVGDNERVRPCVDHSEWTDPTDHKLATTEALIGARPEQKIAQLKVADHAFFARHLVESLSLHGVDDSLVHDAKMLTHLLKRRRNAIQVHREDAVYWCCGHHDRVEE
jgi:hypothetical protein